MLNRKYYQIIQHQDLKLQILNVSIHATVRGVAKDFDAVLPLHVLSPLMHAKLAPYNPILALERFDSHKKFIVNALLPVYSFMNLMIKKCIFCVGCVLRAGRASASVTVVSQSHTNTLNSFALASLSTIRELLGVLLRSALSRRQLIRKKIQNLQTHKIIMFLIYWSLVALCLLSYTRALEQNIVSIDRERAVKQNSFGTNAEPVSLAQSIIPAIVSGEKIINLEQGNYTLSFAEIEDYISKIYFPITIHGDYDVRVQILDLPTILQSVNFYFDSLELDLGSIYLYLW
ncbi:MAG: hypothetical protein EZS28_016362, partial [Streblomastix strix]